MRYNKLYTFGIKHFYFQNKTRKGKDMEQQLRELLETAQPFIESDEEEIALEIIDKFPKLIDDWKDIINRNKEETEAFYREAEKGNIFFHVEYYYDKRLAKFMEKQLPRIELVYWGGFVIKISVLYWQF